MVPMSSWPANPSSSGRVGISPAPPNIRTAYQVSPPMSQVTANSADSAG